MGGLKTISIIVAANIKGLESGLGKANKSLSKFASGAARMGSLMSFGVTAPLTALGKSAFDTFAKFEDGIARVQAVTGATGREIKMLEKEAKRLGTTTRYTALQFADLQLVLGRKGFNPAQIINMTSAVADLALATGEDLSLAAETVSTSINAFGLESTEAARVANTLASAAANSSIQLSTFATAFGHAGASAHAVGVDLEELSAMMGVLMDNGIKASKAGTGLRKIFMKLNKDGTDFTKVLDLATQGELGLEKAMKLAGVTSANQLLILAKNKDKVAELTEEYRTNTGALAKMTDLMDKTTKQKVAIMNSAIESMKIEIGAMLAEALMPMIIKITELAGAFQDLDPRTKEMILEIAGIAAVVGPLLLTLALFATAIGAVGTGFTVLAGLIPFSIAGMSAFGILLGEMVVAGWAAGGALGAVSAALKVLTVAIASNPLGAIAIALVAIGTAVYAFSKDTDAATESLEDFDPPAKTAAERLKEINKQLKNFGKSSIDLTKEELESTIGSLTTELEGLEKELSTIIRNDDFNTLVGGVKETGLAHSDFAIEIAKVESKIKKLQPTLSGYESALAKINTPLEDTTENLKNGKTEAQLYMDMLQGLSDTPVEPVGELKGGRMEMPTADPKILSGFSLGLDNLSWKITSLAEEYGAAFSMMGDISSQFMANRQIENENWYANEKKLIDNSLKSEEEKEEDILALNNKMAEKTATLKKKQAKADKRAAMFNAAINTAVAVTQVVANPILAAIVAALGAVQIAAIASQPIPAFADGGEPPLGQVSLVGERGPELFVPKSRGTIIPNHALGGFGGGQNVSVQVYGTLDAEGIQIATVQGNEIAKQKGNPVLQQA